ncbi:hypothetical protein [Nocardia brasiliensis]|uniref:hypothetical protein n=1 Tax=Nocardia brasiliensis TaxID=37326 RepID=UPI0024540B5C|nr:hypothetical protein [Nocardia brasiliensis]
MSPNTDSPTPFGNLKGGTRVRYGMWNAAKQSEEIHEGVITQVNRGRDQTENEGYYIDANHYIGVLGIKEVLTD